eukprot:CAMPEP_0118898104 /NCGR_PEP_ID=MMETSP1166-20130328/5229_1 /TAXON_ID=1104430 /ORGANISM="Chrysoreinhardia sp, Strain CCMP3193" /LENGTH=812 /DNA_ID=CAMNT_0006837187 /DNA_START=39 /DNA_END=2474 /DNA_ORIENTATION=-
MATAEVLGAVDKAMQGAMKAKPSAATGGAKAVNLEGSALDLTQMRNDNRMELVELLDGLEGKTCLVLDSALGGRLNHVVVEGARLLRDHGVAYFRELKGEDVGDFDDGDEPDYVVYLVRAMPELMADIAKQVKTMIRKGVVAELTDHEKIHDDDDRTRRGGFGGGDEDAQQAFSSSSDASLMMTTTPEDESSSSSSKKKKVRRPKKVQVAMLPRKTLMCQQLLEDHGVLPYVDVSDLHVDFVAFEKDVLSLEMDDFFKEIKVWGDPTCLDFAATAMVKLENTFGRAKTIRTIGPAGRAVAERMSRYRRKSEILKLRKRGCYAPVTQRIFGSKLPPPMPEPDWPEHSDIETLVVIDREVDMVTPLITPLTYEGLIDELFPGGIKNAAVKVPPSVLDGESATPSAEKKQENDDDAAAAEGGAGAGAAEGQQKKKAEKATVSLSLNSNDPLFGEVRDLNVERLGSYLGEKAKQIRGSYDSFRSNKDASINEIHDFVKQIPGLTQKYKSLQTHINLVERVKKTTDGKGFREKWNTERSMLEGELMWDNLEERIGMQEPPMQVLRMLCLQAQTQGGVRGQAKYDFMRREVIQTYGFELLGTLHHLELAGLFYKRRESTTVISSVQNVSAAASSAFSNVMASSGLAADNSTFANLRRQLRLIVDDVDPHQPRDAAYVSSGYAPLSARLVEFTANSNSWAAVGPALANLPGPAMQYDQTAYSLEELDTLMRAHSPRLHFDMENCRPPPTASFLVGGALPPPDTPDDDFLPPPHPSDENKDAKPPSQQQQQQPQQKPQQKPKSPPAPDPGKAGLEPVPVK